MSEKSASIGFDDLSGSVTVNGVSYSLRPKTFELLKLLASAPGRVFSKADILTAVWPDTVVEEQAIFQCVNELRKAFGATELIKTYPRKGYAWVLTADPAAAREPGAVATQRRPLWPARVAAALMLVVALGALLLNLLQSNKQAGQDTMHSGKTLLVLPVKVQQLDSSQHWLRYGAMDALIQQLQADKQLTVYQLADVLAILQRLPAAAEPDISALFNVSGVTEIVQLELTGVPGDYHLLYTLYRPDSRSRGLLQSNLIEQGLPLLAQQLSTTLADTKQATEPGFDQQFQNDLLATALTFLAADELDSARVFIESALVSQPDHVFALYLLAGIYVQQQQPQSAEALIIRALSLLGTSPSLYQARLLFLQGTARLQLGDFNNAAPLLTEAATLAYREQDWLYYAYSLAMAGNSALLQRDYATAYPLLSTALQYQQLLACPQGIAQSQLDLASYFLLTKQPQQAEQYLQQSKILASRHSLTKLVPDIAQLEQKLQQPQL